ncbi:MAG: sortase [Clostridia bacterium]|nr:sortase [Clostridia bacterium]
MNSNKKTGKIIMLVGAVCVIAALLWTFYNRYTDNKAGQLSQEVLQQLDIEVSTDTDSAPDYIINPDIFMPIKVIDGYKYVGTVEIPSIDLTLPVMNEWSTDNSKIAPCVYSGTAYKNDLIIAGHNYKKHFGYIDNLSAGDKVVFTDMDGNVFNYNVIYTEIIGGDATEDMLSGEWDLTLFTCNYSGGARITVRCALAE